MLLAMVAVWLVDSMRECEEEKAGERMRPDEYTVVM
jgi:hypothetical protein